MCQRLPTPMHGRTMAAFTLAATVILLVCQRAFGAEPCSKVHVFYTPAGSERFAQVSLVGEKGRFAVVVRHTLRSQSTNPKPCCRASPAYSGP